MDLGPAVERPWLAHPQTGSFVLRGGPASRRRRDRDRGSPWTWVVVVPSQTQLGARSVRVLPSTVVTRTRLDGRNGGLPPFPSDLIEHSLDFVLWQPAASHHYPGLPVYVADILKRIALDQNQIGPFSNGHRAELRLLSEERGRVLGRRFAPRLAAPQPGLSLASRAPGRIPAHCTLGESRRRGSDLRLCDRVPAEFGRAAR